MRALVVAFLVLVGCGDNLADESDGARSGIRLKLNWYDYDDGPRHWAPGEVYFDSGRNEDCKPVEWDDGGTYCTPETFPRDAYEPYADAGCTDLLAERADVAPYLSERVAACGRARPAHLYPIREPIDLDRYWVKLSDGTCQEVDTPRTLWRLGPEVPRSSLVRLGLEPPRGNSRIALRVRTSVDGMRLPIGYVDSLLGPVEERQFHLWPTGPMAYVADARYADGRCAEPVVPVAAGCPAPKAASGGTTYYTLGEQVTYVPTFELYNGSCVEVSAQPDVNFYRINPVDTVEVQFAATPDAGDRIQLQYWTAADVKRRQDTLWDDGMATWCEPMHIEGDTYRCVPTINGAYAYDLFSDNACTQAQAFIDAISLPSSNKLYARLEHADGQFDVYELGGSYTKPVYRLSGPGTCEPYDPMYRLFSLGRHIEWSELASARLEH